MPAASAYWKAWNLTPESTRESEVTWLFTNAARCDKAVFNADGSIGGLVFDNFFTDPDHGCGVGRAGEQGGGLGSLQHAPAPLSNLQS